MKHFICVIAALWCFVCGAQDDGDWWRIASEGITASSGCATHRDTSTGTISAHEIIGSGVSIWGAYKFLPSATYTVCGLTNTMFATNSPTGSITVGIYTNSTSVANTPGLQVGTDSSSILASSLSATPASVAWSGFTGASVISGGTYWVVVKAPNENKNSVYFSVWHSSISTDLIYGSANSGSSWTQIDSFVAGINQTTSP